MQLQEVTRVKEPTKVTNYNNREKVIENKKSERITYIDTAKAIAIFLTIISHALPNNHSINKYIFSFHIPLFFFLSGWTQKNKTISGLKEWKDFIFKKVCVFIVPYILYALIYVRTSDLSTYKYIFYGTIQSLWKVNGPGWMWFIPCMFSATIIYQIIINFKNSIINKKVRNIVFLLILVICGVVSNYFNYNRIPNLGIPFNLNIALSAVLFMFAGNYTFKLYNICLNKIHLNKNKILISIIAILLLLMCTFLYKMNFESFTIKEYNECVMTAIAWYGNYFIFLINAIICSIGIVLLSMVIDNKFLRYFGKNTLIILYFHIQVLGISNTYITNQLPNGTYKCFVNSIITFLAMGLIIPIINKLFPNLSGKIIKEK